MKRITFLFAALILSFTLLTTACPDRRSIAEIERDPGRYQDKDVVIAGRVVDSYGVSIAATNIGGGAYKVDDGTGSIWVVVADGSVPSRGAQVGVKGRVNSGLNWKGRNYGLGIYEKERKYPRR